jgi:hypothetical protein
MIMQLLAEPAGIGINRCEANVPSDACNTLQSHDSQHCPLVTMLPKLHLAGPPNLGTPVLAAGRLKDASNRVRALLAWHFGLVIDS